MTKRSGWSRWRKRLRRDAGRVRDLAALLWPHAGPHRRLLGAGTALAILLVAARLAQPWPLKWIFDALTGDGAPWPASMAAPFGGLGWHAAAFVVLAAIVAGAEYLQGITLAVLGSRVVASFRTKLYTHVLRQPLAFHEARGTGEMLTRVVSDTARLRRGLIGLLVGGIQNSVLLISTLVVLALVAPALGGIAALAVVLAIPAMTWVGGKIRKAAKRSRRREGRLANVVEESLLGIRDLQIYRPEGDDPQFSKENAKSVKEEVKVRRLEAALLFRLDMVLALGLCLVLWMGAIRIADGLLTAGDLVLVLHYMRALRRPLRQTGRQVARLGRTLAAAERLLKIVRKAPAIADAPDAVSAADVRGNVRVDHVRVKVPARRRGSRKRALRDLSLEVAAGERIAICGPNGAGKSMLLRLVARLIDPKKGGVFIDDRDIRAYQVMSLRRQISLIPQEAAFFGLSARKNIALGDPEASKVSVTSAARQAGMHRLIRKLPERYRTRLQRRGTLLSVGERQRLAIARALLRDGRIWLLDEPTAGLDADIAADLRALLMEVTQDRTTLWVTHDHDEVSQFERVVYLEKGRLRFDGSPAGLDELLSGARVVHGAPQSETV